MNGKYRILLVTGHGFQFRKHKFQFFGTQLDTNFDTCNKIGEELGGRNQSFFLRVLVVKSKLKLKPDDFNFCYLGKMATNVTEPVWREEATILLGSPISPVVNHLPAHVQKWLESPVRYDNYSEARLLVALDPITELSTHVIDCKFKKFF